MEVRESHRQEKKSEEIVKCDVHESDWRREGRKQRGREAGTGEGEERRRENMNQRKIHREVYLGSGTWRKENKGEQEADMERDRRETRSDGLGKRVKDGEEEREQNHMP